MRELLTDSRFGGRARQLAEQVHVRGPWDPLPKILARCRELLG
jgi:hypothetical protein